MKKQILIASYSQDSREAHSPVVFRFESPAWLKRYRFMSHRFVERTGNADKYFVVSEFTTGKLVGHAQDSRRRAVLSACKALISRGEQELVAAIKENPKLNL